MAVIEWSDRASRELEEHLDYALAEFGRSTVKRWIRQIEHIADRLEKYPASYTPVAELQGTSRLFRGCTIMQNFKLIYFYEELFDTVVIVTIWDMRRNPVRLVKLFKGRK